LPGFATNLPPHWWLYVPEFFSEAGGVRSLFRRAAAGCNRPEVGRSAAKRSALRVQPAFLGPPDGRLFRPSAAIEEALSKVGVEGCTRAESSGIGDADAPHLEVKIGFYFRTPTVQVAVSRVANFPHRDLSPASDRRFSDI
jgi:hypothetical protein